MDKKGNDKNPKKWVITITPVTFILAFVMSFVSADAAESLNVYFAVLVLIIIIFIGIIFDIIGISVTSADETPFHAMASKKSKEARAAIFLLRNAEKVSNVCNDVVGDIAGIISGSVGAILTVYFVSMAKTLPEIVISSCLTALTAALTVGGKAAGKAIAINNANKIILMCAKVMTFFGFCK